MWEFHIIIVVLSEILIKELHHNSYIMALAWGERIPLLSSFHIQPPCIDLGAMPQQLKLLTFAQGIVCIYSHQFSSIYTVIDSI